MATAAKRRAPDTFGVPWPVLNDGLFYTDVVKSTSSDSSLIGFYSSKYSSSAPVQGWLQRIRNEQITLDGQVVTDPQTVLRAGSVLVYCRLPWEEPHAPHVLEVLYEDDDVLALNKPSGLQVLPGGLFQQRTVLRQLQWRASRIKSSSISSMASMAEDDQPAPVHRLGRGTSGVLLCAKTKHARVHLASYFADGTASIHKTRTSHTKLGIMRNLFKLYRALVMGIIELDEVVIEQPIGVINYPGVSKGLYAASSSGKPALSKIKVLERNIEKDQTLIQVEIQSGRPHQIRIHLAFLGHPLVGDPLYAAGGHPKHLQSELTEESFAEDGGYCRPAKPVPGDCGYHLHAHKIVFCHPSKNKTIEIVASPPSMLETQEASGKKDAREYLCHQP